MNADAGQRGEIETAELWQPGRLWSLWDMLELKVGRLLELHERLTAEKGYFERSQHALAKTGIGRIRFEPTDLRKLTDTVIEIEQIARSVGLTSTQQAAARTKEFLSQAPLDDPAF